MKGNPDCSSEEQLAGFVEGMCSEEETARIKAHLRQCNRCAQWVQEAMANDAFLPSVLNALISGCMEISPGTTATAKQGVSRTHSFSFPKRSFDEFTILDEIHRGGQGIVYKAEQKSTNRIVALKVLLSDTFASSRQRLRFEREISLVAALNHTNIVTIFDSGVTTDNRYFFVMEYIEGADLNDFLRVQNPDIPEALKLFCTICSAVSYAHNRGVIHRDLKPGNIRIDSKGQPQILDFGLAKADGLHLGNRAGTMTIEGEFMGTLAYASPEQAQGDPGLIDALTDIYSLGVILFEMLSGEHPIEVKGRIPEDLQRIINDVPKCPSSVKPEIDEELETIILKTLSKEKERRYQSVAALADDVERYLANEPIQAKRDSRLYVLKKTLSHYKRKIASGAIVVTVVCVAVGVGTHFWLESNRTNRARRLINDAVPLLEERTQLDTAEEKLNKALEISPEDEMALFLLGQLNTIHGLRAPLEDKTDYLQKAIQSYYDAHLAAGGMSLEQLKGQQIPTDPQEGMGRALLLAGKLSLLAGERDKAESYFALARTTMGEEEWKHTRIYDETKDPLIDDSFPYSDSPEAAHQTPNLNAVLQWGLKASVSSLDPRYPKGKDDAIHAFLFDWFFRIELDNGQPVPKPNPDIIAGPIIKSDDKKTWEIRIRDDVQWHDGHALTSEDIVFSWEQAPESDTTVEKVDENTVRVTFSDPSRAVERDLKFPLLPKHLSDEWGDEFDVLFSRNPIGTGPYRYNPQSSQDHIIIERQDDWSISDSPAYFARVEFRVFKDRTERLQALANGEIDIVELSADEFRWHVNGESFRNHVRKIKHPQWAYEYICWNADGSNPFFIDVNVRRAMAYAMDLNRIVEGRFEDLYTRSTGIFANGSWMFNPDIEPIDQNLEIASQLLDEAGWKLQAPSGTIRTRDKGKLCFSLLVPETSNDFLDLVSDLQEDLRKVGVEMMVEKIQTNEWAKRMKTRDFQAYASRVRTGFHPNEAWERWATGTVKNFGAFSNSEVDELFVQAREEKDETLQPKHYRKIQRLIYHDQPYAFLWHTPTLLAVNKELRGIQLGPLGITRFSPGPRSWWFRADAD